MLYLRGKPKNRKTVQATGGLIFLKSTLLMIKIANGHVKCLPPPPPPPTKEDVIDEGGGEVAVLTAIHR